MYETIKNFHDGQFQLFYTHRQNKIIIEKWQK